MALRTNIASIAALAMANFRRLASLKISYYGRQDFWFIEYGSYSPSRPAALQRWLPGESQAAGLDPQGSSKHDLCES